MTMKTIASVAALAGALVCTAAEPQSEGAGLKRLGAMLDLSRGRVYKVPYLKGCFERMSKMGYNSVMLYTEDTYCLEGVPKWGLTRGGLTLEDVKEIKAAADANGLELVPCIQTLGHLEKWLRWSDSADVRCNDSTILVGEPKTYELIDKMVAFWQEGAGGSRIHVGMDEAWGFADGEYAKRNGNRPKFDVFLEHLKKVCEICNRHGYKEILIWNDMFYGLYRDNKDLSAEEISKKIPAGVRLVFWDYYNLDTDHYRRTIDGHAELNGKPVLAGGALVWDRFIHFREYTLKALGAFLTAAKEKGCPEMWITLWGDNGAYHIPETIDEAMFTCAELAAGRPVEPNDDNCARFKAITGMDFKTISKISNIQSHPNFNLGKHDTTFFYDDPLYMLEIRNAIAKWDGDGLNRLRAWRDALADAEAGFEGSGAPVSCAYSRATLTKLDYSLAMLDAWKKKDADKIKEAAAKLDKAVTAMREFCEIYRDNWNETSQPFGFDLIQKRNSSVLARMEEAKRRVDEYLAGNAATIPEFDEAMKPFGNTW